MKGKVWRTDSPTDVAVCNVIVRVFQAGGKRSKVHSAENLGIRIDIRFTGRFGDCCADKSPNVIMDTVARNTFRGVAGYFGRFEILKRCASVAARTTHERGREEGGTIG